MSVVLGLDPGFSNIGYAFVDLLPDREEVLLLGLIETQKSNKKLNVLATDDNFRRSRLIAEELDKLLQHSVWKPEACCLEAMSFVRSAAVNAKVASTWGVLAALSWYYDMPMVQVTPQQIKQAVTGNIKASKSDIAAALDRRYDHAVLMKAGLDQLPKGKHEHPLDGLSAIITAFPSDLLRMLRGRRKEALYGK